MRVRRFSCRVTSCYYPSWQIVRSTHCHYMLLETLDVFSLYAVVELLVASTSTSPPFSLIVVNASQHRVRRALATARIIT